MEEKAQNTSIFNLENDLNKDTPIAILFQLSFQKWK